MRQAVITQVVVLAMTSPGFAENIRMRLVAVVPGSPERIVGVDAKRRVLLCDPKTSEVVRQLGKHGADIRQLRVSPDGAYVATVSTRGRCRVWDVVAGKQAHAFPLHKPGKDRGAVAFSWDSRLLACGAIGYVDVYSLSDGKRIRRIPERHDKVYAGSKFEELEEEFKDLKILSLDFRPWANMLLIGCDRGVMAYDYLHCMHVMQAGGKAAEPAGTLRYQPDGNGFVALSSSGRADFFDDVKRVKSIQPAATKKNSADRPRYTFAEFSTDGSHLALLGSDGVFRVMRIRDYKLVKKVSPGKVDGGGLALSASRRRVWLGSQGNVERFATVELPSKMWATEPTFD